MAEGEEDRGQRAKGFAGLSSLVSEVDTTLPPAAKREAARASGASPGTDGPAVTQRAQVEPQTSLAQPDQAPPQASSGTSTGKWILGIAAAIAVIWLAGEANKQPSSPTPAYSPSAQTTTPPYPAAPATPAQPEVPSRPNEAKPSVGHGLALSTPQIRYCLAEDIRMNGAKSAINNDSDVDRFNAMVADYNTRCGNFRYRSGALESARRDIEPYRSQLQAEGRNRLARGSSTASLPAPTPSPPAPDATVQIIQRKLNELGYSVGPADGLMGRGTRSAILAFQRHRGISQDGAATAELLTRLESHAKGNSEPERSAVQPSADQTSQKPSIPANAFGSGSSWYCREGFRRVGDQCEALAVPANAFVSGSNWYCREGFRKAGQECEALAVPQNAFVSGSTWYCREGFRRVSDQCEALAVPANAFVSGSNWYCREGFRKIGQECEALVVPQNAFVSGSNWYCREGFRKTGNQCDALDVPANAFVSGSNWYCKEGFRRVGERCEALVVPPNAFVSGSNWYCKEGYRRVGDKCASIFE